MFGNPNSQGEGLYMEAMEKLWTKREKAEQMREIKKKNVMMRGLWWRLEGLKSSNK